MSFKAPRNSRPLFLSPCVYFRPVLNCHRDCNPMEIRFLTAKQYIFLQISVIEPGREFETCNCSTAVRAPLLDNIIGNS